MQFRTASGDPVTGGSSSEQIRAGLGDKDKALDFLEQAYERHEVPMVYAKVRHVLDPIRHDPRFHQVLRRMKFPE